MIGGSQNISKYYSEYIVLLTMNPFLVAILVDVSIPM